MRITDKWFISQYGAVGFPLIAEGEQRQIPVKLKGQDGVLWAVLEKGEEIFDLWKLEEVEKAGFDEVDGWMADQDHTSEVVAGMKLSFGDERVEIRSSNFPELGYRMTITHRGHSVVYTREDGLPAGTWKVAEQRN